MVTKSGHILRFRFFVTAPDEKYKNEDDMKMFILCLQLEGRVLPVPRLLHGKNQLVQPRDGAWRQDGHFYQPAGSEQKRIVWACISLVTDDNWVATTFRLIEKNRFFVLFWKFVVFEIILKICRFVGWYLFTRWYIRTLSNRFICNTIYISV